MCLLLILLREGLVGFVGSRRGEGCTGWTGRGVVGARRGEARSGFRGSQAPCKVCTIGTISILSVCVYLKITEFDYPGFCLEVRIQISLFGSSRYVNPDPSPSCEVRGAENF